MKDLVVVLEDRPGNLAELGEILGAWRINIMGICATIEGGRGRVHILVEDVENTRKALESSGLKVAGDREVLVLDISDRAGALGEIARKIAHGGANVELAYLTADTRLVLGVDDMAKAKKFL